MVSLRRALILLVVIALALAVIVLGIYSEGSRLKGALYCSQCGSNDLTAERGELSIRQRADPGLFDEMVWGGKRTDVVCQKCGRRQTTRKEPIPLEGTTAESRAEGRRFLEQFTRPPQ